MIGDTIKQTSRTLCGRAAGIAITLAILVALLGLDGWIGPSSFALRRAIALVVLAVVAGSRIVRSKRWPIIGWIGVTASLALVARAPSLPVALLAFIFGLAAIEIGPKSAARCTRTTDRVILACLTYVALGFVFDLVPQAGLSTEFIERCAELCIRGVQGVGGPLSFTALGGPPVGLAVLYLLWGWRYAGGIGLSRRP